MLTWNASDSPVVKFDKTSNAYFQILPKEVENGLSTDQMPTECQLQL